MSELADYWVTVCSACRRAICWHGTMMCDEAIGASTVEVSASQLATEDREHPDWYSRKRLLEVCGYVRSAK